MLTFNFSSGKPPTEPFEFREKMQKVKLKTMQTTKEIACFHKKKEKKKKKKRLHEQE